MVINLVSRWVHVLDLESLNNVFVIALAAGLAVRAITHDIKVNVEFARHNQNIRTGPRVCQVRHLLNVRPAPRFFGNVRGAIPQEILKGVTRADGTAIE